MSETTNLLITKPATGQAQPQVTIATGFDGFDAAIAGTQSKTITSADVTLTDAEAIHAVISLTGTLTGNRNLIVPARSKIYLIENLTSGAFNVTVKTAAGTGVVIAQGQHAFVRCDGINVVGTSLAAGDLPSGIDATKLANGSVSNTEFQYLDGVTSAIQTQLNAKAASDLSNLASTALNTGLFPGATGKDLGGASTPFRNLYLHGSGTFGSHSIKLDGAQAANVTLTLPAVTDTLVARTTTDTLTNKTLTAPKIGTSILDTNGNELFNLTATGSAVNELTIANAATGSGPTLSATGGDSNISINIAPKGTGRLNINATAGASTREYLLKGSVSDGGNDGFYIFNGTSADNRFAPSLGGYLDSTNNAFSLGFSGFVSSGNDASDSGTLGIVNFNVARNSSPTDPANGTQTAVVNRKLFTFTNNAGPLLTIYPASLNFAEGMNIVLGTSTGTKIGTATSQKLGFFNATPVTQPSSAAFTNNVTSGGSTDVLADFTDLSTYANDAATIRNNQYQLARKIKEMSDALRLYGILG